MKFDMGLFIIAIIGGVLLSLIILSFFHILEYDNCYTTTFDNGKSYCSETFSEYSKRMHEEKKSFCKKYKQKELEIENKKRSFCENNFGTFMKSDLYCELSWDDGFLEYTYNLKPSTGKCIINKEVLEFYEDDKEKLALYQND